MDRNLGRSILDQRLLAILFEIISDTDPMRMKVFMSGFEEALDDPPETFEAFIHGFGDFKVPLSA